MGKLDPSSKPPLAPPHPKNAPGVFYVAHGECMSCGMPEAAAPDLMREADGCYFTRQPATADEVDRAIRAVRASCCGAVRYAGAVPQVLERIVELVGTHRAAGQCDALAGLTPSQVRRAVELALAREAAGADPLWDGPLDGPLLPAAPRPRPANAE